MWITDIAKKAWTGTKSIGKKIKNKLPAIWQGTKIGTKYIWHITQEGVARGHALLTSAATIIDAPLSNTVNFSVVGVHSLLSVSKRIWKNSSYSFLNGFAVISKQLQASTKLIPLLVILGTSCGIKDFNTLIALLSVSTLLSVSNHALKKLKKYLRENGRERSIVSHSIEFTSDYVVDPVASILARAGQGAIFKDVVEDLVAAFSEEAAESNWMLLFIIVPTLLEIIRYPLFKKMVANSADEHKDAVGFSTFVVAYGESNEKLGYNASYYGDLIAQFGDSTASVVSNEQAFGISAGATVVAAIAGIVAAFHHKKKLMNLDENHLHELSGSHVDIEAGSAIELVEFPPQPGSTILILKKLPNIPLF